MEDKKDLQKELFEEYNNIAKRNLSNDNQLRFRDKVVVKLSAESLVFLGIGVLLILVIAFSLGVEKGRCIVIAKAQKPLEVVTATKAVPLKQEAASKAVIPQKTQQTSAIPQKTEADKSFAIQAITYVKLELAQKEVDALKSGGYQSYVIKSGKYYIVYIGNFSEEEAKVKLRELKQSYKDSFVKKISRRDDS